MRIDADAHVVENDATWQSMPGARPLGLRPPGSDRRFWFIDGKIRGLGARVLDPEQMAAFSQATGRDVCVPEDARDFEDVRERIAHMDRLGVDVQVLSPTLFLEQVADRPEVEVPLCRAYNRWLASLVEASNGRLRWAVVPPLLAMEEALAELRWARERGACAVFLRPIEGRRLLQDPYFAPLYRAAGELGLAVLIHVGNACPENKDLVSQYHPGSAFWKFRLPLIGAFHALVMAEVPEAFPKVRWGFLEAGASWLPVVMHDVRRRLEAQGRTVGPDFLSSRRLFVACDVADDLEYLARLVGEDNFVIGTDYGHADTSSNVAALGELAGRAELPWVEKILSANPRRLFGI